MKSYDIFFSERLSTRNRVFPTRFLSSFFLKISQALESEVCSQRSCALSPVGSTVERVGDDWRGTVRAFELVSCLRKIGADVGIVFNREQLHGRINVARKNQKELDAALDMWRSKVGEISND